MDSSTLALRLFTRRTPRHLYFEHERPALLRLSPLLLLLSRYGFTSSHHTHRRTRKFCTMYAWKALQEALRPTPPRPIPQLPPELLLRVIQLALPPALPDDKLQGRLNSLRSFSLVSKTFRELSKLELFHTIVLPRTARGFLEVLKRNSAEDLARLVKVIFVGGARSKWYIEYGRDVRDAVLLCTNLEQLNLGSVRGIRLDELVRCDALIGLSAINSSFSGDPSTNTESAESSTSPSTTSSSRLRHLDIGRCTLPPGSVPPASAFTNLRAVALWLTPEEAHDSCSAVQELFQHIEPHLQALTISGSVQTLLEPSLRRMSALDLCDVWDFSPLHTLSILTHPIQVLHINMSGRRNGSQPERPPLAISTLQLLLARPVVEKSLARLEEVRVSFEKPPQVAPQYPELAEICKRRGIRINFDLRRALGAHFETEYWRAVRENERRRCIR